METGTQPERCWDKTEKLLKGEPLAPAPQETPAQQELLPCPLLGHEPLGISDGFGPGPYLSISGRPDFLQFYSVVCPGCCSTASYEHRENAIKAWNTRYRDPAFQKLLKVAETLDRLDWITGYELTDANMRILDEALDAAREALRLAREGEG